MKVKKVILDTEMLITSYLLIIIHLVISYNCLSHQNLLIFFLTISKQFELAWLLHWAVGILFVFYSCGLATIELWFKSLVRD